jgi:hypothetical protein
VSTNTAGVGSSWSVLGLFKFQARARRSFLSLTLRYLGEMVLRPKETLSDRYVFHS